MNGRWIKFYEKFLDWKWYKVHNTKILFIHCLLKANSKDVIYKNHLIKRGSFITSRAKLSQETGLTEQQIRTAISNLQSTNELTSKSTSSFSVISVNNYDLYQNSNQPLFEKSTTDIEYRYISSSYIEKYYAREANNVEVEILDKWLKIFNKEIIQLALNESCKNNVKTISYVEGILKNWKKKGYKTLEECNCKSLNKNNEENIETEVDTFKPLFDYDWLHENNEEIKKG